MKVKWFETGNLGHPGEKCFPEQKLSVDFGEVLVCCGENPSLSGCPANSGPVNFGSEKS